MGDALLLKSRKGKKMLLKIYVHQKELEDRKKSSFLQKILAKIKYSHHK